MRGRCNKQASEEEEGNHVLSLHPMQSPHSNIRPKRLVKVLTRERLDFYNITFTPITAIPTHPVIRVFLKSEQRS